MQCVKALYKQNNQLNLFQLLHMVPKQRQIKHIFYTVSQLKQYQLPCHLFNKTSNLALNDFKALMK